MFRALPLVGQLGISLVIPFVFCFLICFWLVKRFNIGYWVFIPGIILALGAFCSTAYKIYKSELNKENDKKGPVAFNEHI